MVKRGFAKKNWFAAGLLLAVVIVFLVLYPSDTLAQAVPAQDTSLLGTAGNLIKGTAAGIVAAALWITQAILSAVLIFLGGALDSLTQINISFVPADYQVVQLGWTMLRDIATSFFILILVWIAITIILDLEKLGGRKLLFRTIVVAVLINFSLAIVSVVFGFANIFADAFFRGFPRDASGQLAVSEHIQNSLQISALMTAMREEDARKIMEEKRRRAEDAKNLSAQDRPLSEKLAITKALGLEEAQAAPLAPIVVGGIVAASAVLFSWVFGGIVAEATEKIFQVALQLGIVDLFLLIAIAAFAVICFLLIMRIVMMTLLSITAPAAFFLHAMPGGWGERYWSLWLNTLIRWAFFAPAFYFLFYIALYMLSIDRDLLLQVSGGARINPAADASYFLHYLMAATFMIASVVMARKIAGSAADLAINATKKALMFGLGAAGTLAGGYIAAPALRALAPTIKKGQEAVSRVPVLGRMTGGLKGVDEYYAKQRGEVNEIMEKGKNFDADEVARRYRTGRFAKEKVAYARILAQKGKIDKIQGHEEEALRFAGQFSPEYAMEILKAQPNLATRNSAMSAGITAKDLDERIRKEATVNKRVINEEDAALLMVLEKIRPQEMPSVSERALDNDHVIEELLRVATPPHISELQRKRPDLARKLTDYIERNPAFTRNLNPRTYEYFTSREARDIGLSITEKAAPPAEIEKTEIQRQRGEAAKILAQEEREAQRTAAGVERQRERLQALEDRLRILQDRARNLETRGRTQEAERVREVDIATLEADIARLKQTLNNP